MNANTLYLLVLMSVMILSWGLSATDLPLMYSTWSPSSSGGLHVAACTHTHKHTLIYLSLLSLFLFFYSFVLFIYLFTSETLSGVKLGIFVYCLYMCVDVGTCMSFCTLTLAFLCLLCGLPLSITESFGLAILYHSRKFNCLPLHIRWFLNATRCTHRVIL